MAKSPSRLGRLTLGLYNCYDPKQWHEIMRITLARAGPVALAFDCDLATFGFPFAQARARSATRTEALHTPHDIAAFVARGSSVGEGGEHLGDLVARGALHVEPFPTSSAPGAFAATYGTIIATTPHPDGVKACTPLDVARALATGQPHLLLFGLGPRGLPPEVLEACPRHLEATGKGVSLETATALGAIPAQVAAHLQHLAN